MGWETSVTELPCPCRKGKIVVTDRSDDWRQSDHTEIMECAECKQLYVYVQVRERSDRPHHWVTREAAAQLERARGSRRLEHEAATGRARALYGNALVRALAPLRSRKAVWERLCRGGVPNAGCSSFAEFNRRVRAQGRDAAIRSTIDDSNVESVLRLIGPRTR